ncbi:uncharacterized protein [Spinacia oleracea]|uniref:Reverse transcriptase domain-containing protein n=1 Tax=Spinacia oleracea TaxID=3562 RepID=A0A9R0IUC8_SPIOL|nr:uncharacterized protein LOC110794658 [Spinacia oleracea]
MFITRSQVVGVQIQARYSKVPMRPKEVHALVTPIRLEDVGPMGVMEFWRDWEEFYMPPYPNPSSTPQVNLQRPLPCLNMKLILWNVRGASKDDFLPYARNIVSNQNPVAFIFLETKADDLRANQVRTQLGFHEFRVVPATSMRGGIWLFWKKDIDLVNYATGDFNFHALFHFKNVKKDALITGMHAPSSAAQRHHVWNTMQSNLPPPSTSWLMVGDLNEVTSQSEKSGGRNFRPSQCRDFTNFTDEAGLVDLGYSGNPFTWDNMRDGVVCIKERLDRALANPTWLHNFPQTQVMHLPRIYSDHSPIVVSIINNYVAGNYPFRCKEVWLEHPNFKDFFIHNWDPPTHNFMEGRKSFLLNIKSWNLNIFGNIGKIKNRLLARLDGIQMALAKHYSSFLVNLEQDLRNQLNDNFKKERIIWAQKAGINCRKHADYNTKYFHLLAKIKKSKGKIQTLKCLNSDDWVIDNSLLKDIASNHFQKIFTTSLVSCKRTPAFAPLITLDETSINQMKLLPTLEEIKSNLSRMDSMKCPGPDGIQSIFYKRFWGELYVSISDFIVDCFRNCCVPEELNRSYISLIPKSQCPTYISDFRPIGLCNTMYKLITKILVSRITPVLGSLISPLQSSFVPNRGIEENIIIVKEVAHFFNKARKGKRIMALKLDITKTYDSLEWSFIRETLLGFKFPNGMVNLIMNCVSSPIISVLWNGEVTKDFRPSRGIRQGDPLSSYLFVLCLERLSLMIEEHVKQNLWAPLKLSKNISLSHIFYADDVFLFGTANVENLDVMMDVLNNFGNASGLRINLAKSSLIFPSNMNHILRTDLSSKYNLKTSSSFGKYLGVQISSNRLKLSNYSDLLQKTTDRIRGWQAKLLNMAGRCTLIKSVLSSYPVYAMQTALLPFNVLTTIEKGCRKFLWNKVDRSRYVPRTSWTNVVKPMQAGGLGIRRLKEWNLAFMAKLGWTMLTQPHKLWVRIMNDKYLHRSALFNASPQPYHSPLWRDILKGRSLLEKGLKVGIGNGTTTSLWYYHWVGAGPIYQSMDIDVPNSKAHWFVSHIIRYGKWNLDDINHLIPNDLKEQILATPLPQSSIVEDFIHWVPSKEGSFSIKSAYNLLLSSPPDSSQSTFAVNHFSFPWKSLWKLRAPFKYKMLLWNCMHEILPCAKSLNRFATHISPLCVRCNLQEESHLHIFRDCSSSSILWNYIFQRVLIPNAFNFEIFQNSTWSDWIDYNLKLSDSWKIIFIVAIWHLWKHRNSTVFEQKMGSAFSLFNAFYVDWKITVSVLQGKGKEKMGEPIPPHPTWIPPAKGFMKLNTDGAWKGIDKAGGGGVLRKETSDWFLGYSSKFNAKTSLAAELLALREGLSVAKAFNVEKFEVETDADSLIFMLDTSTVNSYPHHELVAVIEDVRKLMVGNWDLQMRHIPRHKNLVAHGLAAIAMEMAVGHKSHFDPPAAVQSDYENDKKSAMVIRARTIGSDGN